MPKIKLIRSEDVPINLSRAGAHVLLADLREYIRAARRTNQVIRLDLTEADRPARLIKLLRQAADDVGVIVSITGADYRARTTETGRAVREASVLYAQVTKAVAKPAQPSSRPGTIDTLSRPPITTPHAGYEPTLLPGVEVSR